MIHIDNSNCAMYRVIVKRANGNLIENCRCNFSTFIAWLPIARFSVPQTESIAFFFRFDAIIDFAAIALCLTLYSPIQYNSIFCTQVHLFLILVFMFTLTTKSLKSKTKLLNLYIYFSNIKRQTQRDFIWHFKLEILMYRCVYCMFFSVWHEVVFRFFPIYKLKNENEYTH